MMRRLNRSADPLRTALTLFGNQHLGTDHSRSLCVVSKAAAAARSVTAPRPGAFSGTRPFLCGAVPPTVAPAAALCDCGLTKEELFAQMDKYNALVIQRRDAKDASAAEAREFLRDIFEQTFQSQSEAWPTCKKHGRFIAEHPAQTTGLRAAGLEEARALFDPARIYEHVLTDTKTEYVGRAPTMEAFADIVAIFHDSEALAALSNGKPQPIVATAATTGVGKSRMLHEIRSDYTAKGYVVVVVTYNSVADLAPVDSEMDCDALDTVERCFLSRLVSMLLPKESFDKWTLATRFNLTVQDVATLLAEKCIGPGILLLVDEVGMLAHRFINEAAMHRFNKEAAMHRVISVLAGLAGMTSDLLASEAGKLASLPGNRKCIGMFTALSPSIIFSAKTSSGRTVKTFELPLLERVDVCKLLEEQKATKPMQNLIFSLSAGHARTVARCLAVKWVAGQPAAPHDELLSLLSNATTYSTSTLDENEVRAILLDDATAVPERTVDFLDLSRRSLVVVSPSSRVMTVPAFLFQWCTENHDASLLARHLHACFVAVWNRVFLAEEKQGTGGPFEQFIWHFEAVRRELLLGRTMTAKKFLCLTSAPPIADKQFTVTSITSTRRIPNDFDCSSLADGNTRYEPEKPNFPLYDFFSGWQQGPPAPATAREMWAWQTKHGSGRCKPATPGVVSVFVTTLPSEKANDWSEKGWLVLAGDDLKKYLGPTMSAAAAALIQPPLAAAAARPSGRS